MKLTKEYKDQKMIKREEKGSGEVEAIGGK